MWFLNIRGLCFKRIFLCRPWNTDNSESLTATCTLHWVKALLSLVGFVRMWHCVAHCVTCKRQYLQLLSFTKGLSLHTVFMFYDSFFWQHQIMSGKSSQLPHSCQICANKKRARCSPPYRPGVQLAHMCTLEATSRCCCGAGFSIGHMTKFGTLKQGAGRKARRLKHQRRRHVCQTGWVGVG